MSPSEKRAYHHGNLAESLLQAVDELATALGDSKRDEALRMGAHHVVNSRNDGELEKTAGSLDFLICTANVPTPPDAPLTRTVCPD